MSQKKKSVSKKPVKARATTLRSSRRGKKKVGVGVAEKYVNEQLTLGGVASVSTFRRIKVPVAAEEVKVAVKAVEEAKATEQCFDNTPIPRKIEEVKPTEEVKGSGGPRITKGKSDGDYATPDNFLQAVQKKFGPIVYDLAASAKNATCERFFSITDDAMKQDWAAVSMKYSGGKIGRGGILWLNPPFSFIAPWASRSLQEGKLGAEILFLVPASVGAKWFRDFVFRQAEVYYLYGRLTFRGQTTPYPKDCMLVHFNPGSLGVPYGEQIWDWRKEVPAKRSLVERSTGKASGAVRGKDASQSIGAAAGV